MAKIGYARVSSIGQSLDVQLDKLSEYGCKKIYKEKKTGTTADRSELKAILDYVRDGDFLVITKLDRLARSTFHLTQIAEGLKQKNVELVVLDQNIDTSTLMESCCLICLPQSLNLKLRSGKSAN